MSNISGHRFQKGDLVALSDEFSLSSHERVGIFLDYYDDGNTISYLPLLALSHPLTEATDDFQFSSDPSYLKKFFFTHKRFPTPEEFSVYHEAVIGTNPFSSFILYNKFVNEHLFFLRKVAAYYKVSPYKERPVAIPSLNLLFSNWEMAKHRQAFPVKFLP